MFICGLSIGSPSLAVAQDVITLAPRADGVGRIVMSGKVIDYTGTTLTYENAAGTRQSVPGKQVVEVTGNWAAEQSAGDEAWRRRDFDTAAAKYQAALATEQRRWVRRLLLARLTAVERERGRWEIAVENFLSLCRDDPATPYFQVVPLPWTTIDVAASLQSKAQRWVDDRTSSLGALLGSALLLSTTSRPDALRRLRELTGDGDPRIALLADAQSWRAAIVTADAAQISGWERTVEKLPESLRAGPYFTVGRAWLNRNEPERAALSLLRVPILEAREQPRLAAEALWSAGQSLERLARTDQAAGVYRELVRDFPNAVAATTARERLKELQPPTR